MSRRQFLPRAAFAPAAAQILWNTAGNESKRRLLFVGTQTKATSKGIYAYHWDPATGELESRGLAVESDNPTYLALDPTARFLYAANELDDYRGNKTGAVSSFAVDRVNARLKPLNEIAAEGTGTCNVTTDHVGRCVFCANYTGGSATSFFVDPDGQLSDPVSHFQYQGHGPDADRQASPHAHRVTVSPDDRFLLVNDLGLDCIHIYRLDDANAKLTPNGPPPNSPPSWQATPGSGPRALRFHPNGRIAYCVCELTSEVDVLHWNPEQGRLTSLQKTSLIPEDFHGATRGCDIVLDRHGHFAYAANRDYDCLVTFAVEKDGKLRFLDRSGCGGKNPRDLALDPTERWLLVANQSSDAISVFSRDPKTGKLGASAKNFPISIPQCLVFA